MGLKQKKKVNRKVICGRGFCDCKGKGFVDIDSKVLESIPESIDNVMKINDSTKTIVKEIMNKRKPQNIVDKINRFKKGSGFVYV